MNVYTKATTYDDPRLKILKIPAHVSSESIPMQVSCVICVPFQALIVNCFSTIFNYPSCANSQLSMVALRSTLINLFPLTMRFKILHLVYQVHNSVFEGMQL